MINGWRGHTTWDIHERYDVTANWQLQGRENTDVEKGGSFNQRNQIKTKQTNPKKFNSNSKENRYLFLHLPQLSITYLIPVLLLFPFIHQSQGFLFQFSFSCLSDSRDYVFSVAQTLFLLRCKLLFLVAIEKGPFVCSCLLLLMSITVADGNWLVIVNTPNSSPLQHTHSSFSKRRWDKEFSELQSG